MEKPYLLLNIYLQYEEGVTDRQLYARTRKYWVLNPNLRKHKQVTRVVAVANNVIRAIYYIDPNAWRKCDMPTEGEDLDRRRGVDRPSKSRYRWEFTGEKDEKAWGKFVGQDIPQELKKRQNPISWVI